MQFTLDSLGDLTVANTREKSTKWQAFLDAAEATPGNVIMIPASAGTYMTKPREDSGKAPERKTSASRDETAINTAVSTPKGVVQHFYMAGGRADGHSRKLYLEVTDESSEYVEQQWLLRPDADKGDLLVADNPETGVESFVCFGVYVNPGAVPETTEEDTEEAPLEERLEALEDDLEDRQAEADF